MSITPFSTDISAISNVMEFGGNVIFLYFRSEFMCKFKYNVSKNKTLGKKGYGEGIIVFGEYARQDVGGF